MSAILRIRVIKTAQTRMDLTLVHANKGMCYWMTRDLVKVLDEHYLLRFSITLHDYYRRR